MIDDNFYLQRHFAVFSLAAPEGEGLKNVVHCVLEAHMTQNDSPGLVIDLHNAIVQASCRLLQLTQRTLKAADMPGREYYAFSLRDINNCFMVCSHIHTSMLWLPYTTTSYTALQHYISVLHVMEHIEQFGNISLLK